MRTPLPRALPNERSRGFTRESASYARAELAEEKHAQINIANKQFKRDKNNSGSLRALSPTKKSWESPDVIRTDDDLVDLGVSKNWLIYVAG